jgi:hypothetical protein
MMSSARTVAVDYDAIRSKAYELWVSGGCQPGVAEQNWLEAERIVASRAKSKPAPIEFGGSDIRPPPTEAAPLDGQVESNAAVKPANRTKRTR